MVLEMSISNWFICCFCDLGSILSSKGFDQSVFFQRSISYTTLLFLGFPILSIFPLPSLCKLLWIYCNISTTNFSQYWQEVGELYKAMFCVMSSFVIKANKRDLLGNTKQFFSIFANTNHHYGCENFSP